MMTAFLSLGCGSFSSDRKTCYLLRLHQSGDADADLPNSSIFFIFCLKTSVNPFSIDCVICNTAHSLGMDLIIAWFKLFEKTASEKHGKH